MLSKIGQSLGNAITTITKPDAMAPIVGLEAVVVTGRTGKAYKRGGKEEARERVIEELTGSVVWLGGVKSLNYVGDKFITKALANGKNADVDVGVDALRNPFKNFLNNKAFNPKNISAKTLSRMKFAKIATSVIAANAVTGFIVPPLNHKLTEKLSKKNKNVAFKGTENQKSRFEMFTDSVNKNNNKNSNLNFKGGLNPIINFVENTNTGALLSSDAGMIGGRALNSRRKEEVVEVGVRDGGSIYFYMFAQPHARAVLNKLESGRWTRLDPSSANITHDHLANMFTEPNSSMSVEEFKNRVFGKTDTNIDLGKYFEEGQQVIDLEKFNTIEKDPKIQARALEMSKLQPQQQGVSLLSREQVLDVYKEGEINSPKFLKNAYEAYTDGKSSNPNKFVPMEKLSKHKQNIHDYVSDICKAAEKNKGVVDLKLLKKVKRNNLIFNGINFATGFAFAAVFLAKLIPTFQYWLTKKMTGVDAFPGTYDYNQQQANNKNVDKKA